MSFKLVLFIIISFFIRIRWRVGLKVFLFKYDFIIDLVNELNLLSLLLRYRRHLVLYWCRLCLTSSIWTCLLNYWVIDIALGSIYFVSGEGAVRYWCLRCLFLFKLLLLAMIRLSVARLDCSIRLQAISILTLIALSSLLALVIFKLFSQES